MTSEVKRKKDQEGRLDNRNQPDSGKAVSLGSERMAAEESMTWAITQAAIEAAKAIIMVVREGKNLVSSAGKNSQHWEQVF